MGSDLPRLEIDPVASLLVTEQNEVRRIEFVGGHMKSGEADSSGPKRPGQSPVKC